MQRNFKHIYMIGIGGISMSAIAEYLTMNNYKVSGSDRTESLITQRLRNKNVNIYIGHDEKNLDETVDLVVYTAAIHDDNPEFIKANKLGIKMVNRAKFLGMIMEGYKYSIAVAGSHGKTSVTAMISEILLKAQKDPTIFLGGILPSINENFRMGHSDYFVMEACEYCDSFLNFFPKIGVINNVDLDHVDYFKSLEQMEKSFEKFAQNVKDDGVVIINASYKNVIGSQQKKVVTFGNKNADWRVENLILDENQCAKFSAVSNDLRIDEIKLKVPGYFNVLNSLAAISAACELQIDEKYIKNALENFHGAQRRFEFKGTFRGAKIFDDYAHHPNEIKETISAVEKMLYNNLWCVFQPHTYTRTKMFLDDFAKVLCNAGNVILADIYAAREKNIYGISSKDLTNKIKEFGGNAIYFDSFDEITNYLEDKISINDLVITIGAGDIYKVGEKLLQIKC